MTSYKIAFRVTGGKATTATYHCYFITISLAYKKLVFLDSEEDFDFPGPPLHIDVTPPGTPTPGSRKSSGTFSNFDRHSSGNDSRVSSRVILLVPYLLTSFINSLNK